MPHPVAKVASASAVVEVAADHLDRGPRAPRTSRAGSRTSRRGRIPASISAPTTWLPTNPVPPVTATGWRIAGRQAASSSGPTSTGSARQGVAPPLAHSRLPAGPASGPGLLAVLPPGVGRLPDADPLQPHGVGNAVGRPARRAHLHARPERAARCAWNRWRASTSVVGSPSSSSTTRSANGAKRVPERVAGGQQHRVVEALELLLDHGLERLVVAHHVVGVERVRPQHDLDPSACARGETGTSPGAWTAGAPTRSRNDWRCGTFPPRPSRAPEVYRNGVVRDPWSAGRTSCAGRRPSTSSEGTGSAPGGRARHPGNDADRQGRRQLGRVAARRSQ